QVDDADRALQSFFAKQRRCVISVAQVQPETRDADAVKELLIAAAHAGADALALGRFAPIRRGGDRAGVSAEADRERIALKALAHKLADIQLAALAHLRRARVAEMRVVRPDDDLRAPTVEMLA